MTVDADSNATTDVLDPMVARAGIRVGSVLRGKWRLDALLGVGGMAAVYAATHRTGSRAAVKVLHTEWSVNPQTRSRFLREGYLANKVAHDGAVKVIDDDVADDGALFLVTELLDGETLDDRRIRLGGRLPRRSDRRRSAAQQMKTNAARLLDALAIRYELCDYDPGDEHLTAEQVASRVGLPAEQVFKTLVARGDRTGVILAVVPGDTALDLKALAKLTGDRKCDTVTLKEVTPLTGYVRGGVTALACRKPYATFVDETVELFDVISVSAGARGTQILLAPADYLRATKGKLGAIAKPKE
ncbi:MAG TPA: Cys-tRNA(Pro) deacylase [Polyangiaceae bacterium]|nr:Cys-tRNA(Pro) deacylase [Polyangiaceae bacterium]